MFLLSEQLAPAAILCDQRCASRDALVHQMVAAAALAYGWTDGEEIARRVLEREAKLSTAIGLGIAVPHARLENRDRVEIVVSCLPEGIDFSAPDGRPVRLVVLLVSPLSAPGIHVQALASVSRISMDLVDRLVKAPDPGRFLEILGEWESTRSK